MDGQEGKAKGGSLLFILVSSTWLASMLLALLVNDGDVAFCDDALLLEASHTFANGSHKKRSYSLVPHDSFKINHSSDTLSHIQREKSRTEGLR